MPTVYVAMSGGVDSSVSAALLQRQGYRVVGVYMKNWTEDFDGVDCPWKEDLADAKVVAAKLGIPLVIYDFQKEYKAKVVDYMLAEYQAGRTPNPDIMCNQEIKFKLFFDTAMADGADMIATGHYAGTTDGRLFMASDDTKDQSYFLHRVSSEALAKTIFPLARMAKKQVRELAAEFGLEVASKPDSVGVCFVGEVGMKTFLSKYLSTAPGDIVLASTGEVIGQHDGAVFYTIGQRQGLGVGGGRPYYVIGKDMAKNQVFVTNKPADRQLTTNKIKLIDVHWITQPPLTGQQVDIRVRHLGQLHAAVAQRHADGASLQLTNTLQALSPGQSVVLYDGQQVLGGGIISS